MGLSDPGWFPNNRICGEITEWDGVIWCRSDRSEREGGEGEFSHFDSLAAPRLTDMPIGFLLCS